MLSIFRIVELMDEIITIDGIDMLTLPRNLVQFSLNNLPQDPFFLNGKAHDDLDAFVRNHSKSDAEIWRILTPLYLDDTVRDMGSLNASIDIV